MDWNSRYDQEDTPWDKGEPSPVLDEIIAGHREIFCAGMKAFLPGCGYGHDTQLLTAQDICVTAADISQTALDGAQQRYGKSELLAWLHADIFNLPQAHHLHYDLIWEHTCYCAITPELRSDYVDSMFQLLKPGGYFIGVFFTDTGIPIEEGPPYVTSRDEVVENFGRKFHLLWEGLPSQSYPGRENREWLVIWKKP